jgi:hypothetical protein
MGQYTLKILHNLGKNQNFCLSEKCSVRITDPITREKLGRGRQRTSQCRVEQDMLASTSCPGLQNLRPVEEAWFIEASSPHSPNTRPT